MTDCGIVKSVYSNPFISWQQNTNIHSVRSIGLCCNLPHSQYVSEFLEVADRRPTLYRCPVGASRVMCTASDAIERLADASEDI